MGLSPKDVFRMGFIFELLEGPFNFGQQLAIVN
jgi:hypothetical protein